MNKVIKYVVAYAMWIADLGLTFWLIFISRTAFLDILALFYKEGSWQYYHKVDFADKVFMLILGLGWLAFMIVAEGYFRAGAAKSDLLKRFGRITGPVLLVIFSVDMILFWLQGIGSWLRWLILVAELGLGIALLVSVKPQSKSKPN